MYWPLLNICIQKFWFWARRFLLLGGPLLIGGRDYLGLLESKLQQGGQMRYIYIPEMILRGRIRQCACSPLWTAQQKRHHPAKRSHAQSRLKHDRSTKLQSTPVKAPRRKLLKAELQSRMSLQDDEEGQSYWYQIHMAPALQCQAAHWTSTRPCQWSTIGMKPACA